MIIFDKRRENCNIFLGKDRPPALSALRQSEKAVKRYEHLTDKQLSDAIAEKAATAHTERSAAALLAIPVHLAMAKRIEEQIADLKAEQSRRAASD